MATTLEAGRLASSPVAAKTLAVLKNKTFSFGVCVVMQATGREGGATPLLSDADPQPTPEGASGGTSSPEEVLHASFTLHASMMPAAACCLPLLDVAARNRAEWDPCHVNGCVHTQTQTRRRRRADSPLPDPPSKPVWGIFGSTKQRSKSLGEVTFISRDCSFYMPFSATTACY